MYFLVLALAVLTGANAANPAQCIRTAAQNATANLTLVIREDINRSFSGSNNVTGRTHDIISNATSLIVKNITDAFQPVVNSNTTLSLVGNTARALLNVTNQFPSYVVTLTRAGDQIGSNGGVFLAREIAASVQNSAYRAIYELRKAVTTCLTMRWN